VLLNAAQTPPPAASNLSVEQFIATMVPEGLRPAFQQMHQNTQAKKQSLIANIMASPANRFTAEYLATQEPAVLEGMAALCTSTQAQQTPTFLGNGATPILVNASQQYAAPQALVAPELFAPKAAK
jgi:hypothetical protein